VFVPFGLAPVEGSWAAYGIGLISYLAKLAAGGFALGLFETSIAKMRVFRVPEFFGRCPDAWLSWNAAALRFGGVLMTGQAFDISHLLAGGLVLVSFMMLYQDRLPR
jgi:hypothetical protein